MIVWADKNNIKGIFQCPDFFQDAQNICSLVTIGLYEANETVLKNGELNDAIKNENRHSDKKPKKYEVIISRAASWAGRAARQDLIQAYSGRGIP